MKKVAIAAVAVCLVIVVVYRVRSKRPEKKQEIEPYNIILISIDTVRADFLQLYNPQGTPTPNLNRIAENAFLFTTAIAQAPYTLPSHCSLLTGTYPLKHRVQQNTAVKLTEQAVTLAEVLKAHDYKTAAFIGSMVLGSNTGIDQGFEFYDDSFSHSNIRSEDAGGIQKEAGLVYRSFKRWFEKREAGKFFAFIHFYDPHEPYDPPASFRPEQDTEVDRYKGELRYVDSIIGELYDHLAALGIWKNTVLMITGDHGEMFGEHQETGHGYFIYQEAVKIPLIVALPGNHQRTIVHDVVQLVDVMPTTLNILGINIPAEVQGESFSDTFTKRVQRDRFAFSESLTSSRYFGTSPLRSIQNKNYKYIDNARPELYNVQLDAREASNLVNQQKEIASRMKARLDEMVERFSGRSKQNGEKREMSAEEKEKLASLGYLDIQNSLVSPDSSRDAKDYVRTWMDVNRISTLLDAGNYNEALNFIERIRKMGIHGPELLVYEARAYQGLGDHRKAIAMLEQLTASDPENTQAWMALAYSFRSAGKTGEAITIYKRLMEKEDSLIGLQNFARLLIRFNRKEELLAYLNRKKSEGKFSDRHNEMLGEIYLQLRDFDQASFYLQKATISHPDSSSTYINYSAVLASQGKIQQAVALLEENRSRFSDADYLLQLGRMYSQSGQLQKELDTFKAMAESFPRDPRGYFFLAKFLLEHNGDPRSVIQLAERGLRLNPTLEFQPFGYFLLGDAYTRLGMDDKAKEYLVRAEKLRADAGKFSSGL